MEPLHPASEGQAMYLRIADAISRSILSGQYPPGAKLPGRNVLAARFQTAAMTVTNAYAELVRRGIVAAQRGAGTFVSADAVTILSGPEGISAFRAEVAELRAVVAQHAEEIAALRAALADVLGTTVPQQRGPGPDAD